MTDQLEAYVLECGIDSPRAILSYSLQEIADQLHDSVCQCGGIRWIDCHAETVKQTIRSLFKSEARFSQPYHWTATFAAIRGYFTVTRVTIWPLPNVTPQSHFAEQQGSKPSLTLSFTVPLLPPSVNHYIQPNKRGGWRLSKAAAAFYVAVPVFARPAAPADWPWDIDLKISGPRPFYEVDLIFHVQPHNFLKRDGDNMEKVAFDALKACGAISDDRYIKYHTNRMRLAAATATERTDYAIRIVPEPTL